MRDDDRKEFSVALLACAEMFDRRLSGELIKIYWSLLLPHGIGEVKSAMAQWMATGTRMPVAADLINILNGGSADERALRTWPKVLATFGRYYLNGTETLIPDGAAGMALNELISYGLPEGEMKYQYQLYRNRYEEYFRRGYASRPAVAGGKYQRYVDSGKKFRSPFLMEEWWPPEDVARHRKELDKFMPGHDRVYEFTRQIPGPSDKIRDLSYLLTFDTQKTRPVSRVFPKKAQREGQNER
jgi:hypothetical protein